VFPAVIGHQALADVTRSVVGIAHEVDDVVRHGDVGYASDEARRILVKRSEYNVVHATCIVYRIVCL